MTRSKSKLNNIIWKNNILIIKANKNFFFKLYKLINLIFIEESLEFLRDYDELTFDKNLAWFQVVSWELFPLGKKKIFQSSIR